MRSGMGAVEGGEGRSELGRCVGRLVHGCFSFFVDLQIDEPRYSEVLYLIVLILVIRE